MLSSTERMNGAPPFFELTLIVMVVSSPVPVRRIPPDAVAPEPGEKRKMNFAESPGGIKAGVNGPPINEYHEGPFNSVLSIANVSHIPKLYIVNDVSNVVHGGILSTIILEGNESERTFGLTVPTSLRVI